MITISRISPNVWNALQTHSQDLNQAESGKSRKTLLKESTLLGQVAYSAVFCNSVLISPEVLIQVVMDGVGYNGYLLVQLKDNRGLFDYQEHLWPESKGLSWVAIALVVGSAIISRIKEKFLIIVSFIFIPNERSRDLPKGVNPVMKAPGGSFLTQQYQCRGINQ